MHPNSIFSQNTPSEGPQNTLDSGPPIGFHMQISNVSFLIIASLFSHFALAEDGTRDGGGGGAFVCRDSAGAVTSVELLDLWEARELSGL